jgi:PAS domain S-box-containing protein
MTRTDALPRDIGGGESRVLLLLFFTGAVGMPHMFHMVFAENTDSQNLRIASWALPLYLCFLSLPILPITWAGIKLGHHLPVEYSGLAVGLALQSTPVAIIAFVAGLSASSAAIIVTTLALANMCLHHLVLPGRVLQFDREQNIYGQLKWLRRALISIFILAGYCFFLVLEGRQSLSELGLTAFIGTLQFFPGIVATPYWQGANRKGLLIGLGAGLSCWFAWVVLPAIAGYPPPGLGAITPVWLAGEASWAAAALLSLAVNAGLFILVSLATRATAQEQVAAEICSMDSYSRPTRQTLAQQSAGEFARELASALGEATAQAEVDRAMEQLQLDPDESRPYALRRVRNRIESNLAGLLGPAVAHSIINRCLPFQRSLQESVEDINLIERNLDRAQLQFTGRAAELDNLRRHYRGTLDNLPIGVCSSAMDGELTMWNRCMEQITGIGAARVLGSHLGSLPAPWNEIIGEFIASEAETVLKKEVNRTEAEAVGQAGTSRWVSLQKAGPESRASGSNDQVILVEDITDYELMEEELLHSERLASIGRLAAGVAHEIGNPVTGIACLAQNLEYENEPDEIRRTAHDILKQTERVTRIVHSLVNFSHTGSAVGDTDLAPCNLADCVDEAIHLLQLDIQARVVQFRNRCDREVVVSADSQRLLQVFINLLANARDACDDDDDGVVLIDAKWDDTWVEIVVEDNGCGIPAHLHSRVFEPFFSSKDPGEGTGLGLSLAYSIMEDMGGSIQLQSPVNDGDPRGACFTLKLARDSYGPAFDS